MVVGEVAGLTHAHGVEQAVFVRASPRCLISAILSVTTGAHILLFKSYHEVLMITFA